MKALEALRKANERMIAENPVEIAVHRTEYLENGTGGRSKEESDLPPFSGRLVPSRQTVQERRNEAGGMTVAAWTLLAPHDADLRAGDGVEDVFTVAGRRYRVAHVAVRSLRGEAYAVHAACEEVS